MILIQCKNSEEITVEFISRSTKYILDDLGKNCTLSVPRLLIHKTVAGKLLFSPGYDKSMNFLGSSHIFSNIRVSPLISTSRVV